MKISHQISHKEHGITILPAVNYAVNDVYVAEHVFDDGDISVHALRTFLGDIIPLPKTKAATEVLFLTQNLTSETLSLVQFIENKILPFTAGGNHLKTAKAFLEGKIWNETKENLSDKLIVERDALNKKIAKIENGLATTIQTLRQTIEKPKAKYLADAAVFPNFVSFHECYRVGETADNPFCFFILYGLENDAGATENVTLPNVISYLEKKRVEIEISAKNKTIEYAKILADLNSFKPSLSSRIKRKIAAFFPWTSS